MLFELTDVTYSRDGRRVLNGLTVSLPVGASCLFGPSGSGKSTVLRLLDRLIDPDSGTVTYEGADVRERDPLALRREVVLVPQVPALVEGSVAENVAFGPRLAGHSYDSRSALELAGLDASFASRPADRLSVGEQQRVMLARALALQPRVLLLDEPTSALDAEATAAVERTLASLRARTSISLVLVTHDLAQAERVAERIVRIEKGRAVAAGSAAEIAAAERERRAEGGVSSSIDISFAEVAASLVLVAVALAASRWRGAGLERDIGVAVVRSFIQLTAIGLVINFIFEQDDAFFVIALLAVMVVFGAFTARHRAPLVPDALGPLVVSLALAAATTLGLVLALGIIEAEPRFVVPVGGMVIGNAMTAAAVSLNRLGEDVRDSSQRIEATLALGATSSQAVAPIVRRSLRSGMITLVDSTKTTGLIFFPGTMVGMLLAGADPVDAVRLQLILLYTLLGSVAIAALTATTLARRNFFTPAHQLREPPAP